MKQVVQNLIRRFLAKNPKWVTKLQWVLAGLAAALFLPDVLQWLTIPVPEWWEIVHSKIASLIAIGAAIGLQPMFVANPPAQQQTSDDGNGDTGNGGSSNPGGPRTQ